MAVFPSDSIRTKNWGTEILTDSDLEAQLDLLHAYFTAALNATTGHTHDGTSNQGPLLTTLGTLTTILKEDKGADVASAAGNIVLGDDGNFFDITGTDAITSITIKPTGTMVTLQTDSTASLVDGGNLKLAGTFQGAADSTITLRSDGTNWYEVSRSPGSTPTAANALSGSVIQMVNSQESAYDSGTTVMPYDDTIPQNTEGDEYLTLSITPSNASNLLQITAIVHGGTTTNEKFVAALFQDSTAGALNAAVSTTSGTATDTTDQVILTHRMTAGTTSATTFKVRVGPYSAATFHFNGSSGASTSRFLGGVLYSSITITEIKA